MRRRANRSMVLWLACLMLPGVGARAAEPDAAASNARLAVHETVVIDRARVALDEGDVRRALMVVIAFERGRGTWGEEQLAGDAEAAVRKAALSRLAVEAIALAQARGADDALVQLFLALVCDRPWANCDADAAVTRLAELEPDNGLAAVVALNQARQLKDAAGERAAVTSLANATRFESHEVHMLTAARDFVAGAALPATPGTDGDVGMRTEDRLAEIAFMLWVVAPTTGLLPGGLGLFCRAAAGRTDDHADCIAAARVLAASDALVVRRFGLVLLEELVEDADERLRIRGLRRDLDWQMSATGELARQVGESPGSLASHLHSQIEAGGELGYWAKTLADAGLPLTAPADWVPTDPRLRD